MTRPSLRLAPPDVVVRPLPDGGLVLRSRQELGPYAASVGELLRRWAAAAPDRTFLAERAGEGDWRRVSYGEALAAVEAIASALLLRGLTAAAPVVLLSDNGIDHALLQLAAMHVGIPAVPVSPAYSLLLEDLGRLRAILELVRPGLVYAADGAAYGRALAAVPDAVEVAVGANPPDGRPATPFRELLAAEVSPDVAEHHARVGPDTVAKVLFTSGSTGQPKGVLNTQRMLCSNQQAIAQGWPFLEDRPPVIVDWLPWSHTFGGNHNFNLILRNGGTLYIDAGKPAPGRFAATLKNLREVPSTLHFNVPRGFDMLVPALAADRELCATFFRDLDALFFAAAALPPHLAEQIGRLAVETTGRRVPLLSAWGSTETAPCATQIHFEHDRPGVIGLPLAGTEIKLAPVAGKLELRVRGPNVTPGYFGRPPGGMFDDDGFLPTGDAGRLVEPDEPARGLLFDGRLAENFKLTSGTWVHVGELRVAAIAAGAPVVQDAVVTGHDREEVGLLVFANPAGCRTLCPEAPESAPLAALIRRTEVRDALAAGLAAHTAGCVTSSRRIARVLLLAEPPSIEHGEITDKGYVNQRAVLDHRAEAVARLYAADDDPDRLQLV
ncbi:MAG TPA: feruloyl-CoA synthase [Thermoanaerobaculia bacterium]